MVSQWTQLDRDDAILQEIKALKDHHKELDLALAEYKQFLQQSLQILRQEHDLLVHDTKREMSTVLTDLDTKIRHTQQVNRTFSEESARILDLHKLEIEKEKDLHDLHVEKRDKLHAQLDTIASTTETALQKEKAKRIAPFQSRLEHAEQSLALSEAKIEAEEAEFDELLLQKRKTRKAVEESFLKADEQRKAEYMELSERVSQLRAQVAQLEEAFETKKQAAKRKREREKEKELEEEIELARLGLYGKALLPSEKRKLEAIKHSKKGKKKGRPAAGRL